jgi:hypothetical protein
MRRFTIGMHDRVHAAIRHFVSHANKAQAEIVCTRTLVPDDIRASLAADPLKLTPARRAELLSFRSRFELQPEDSLTLIVDGNIADAADDEYFIGHGLDWGKEFAGLSLMSLHFLSPRSEFMRERGEWWGALSDRQREKLIGDIILVDLLAIVAYDVAGLQYHDETGGCAMDLCQKTSDILDAARGGIGFCELYCVEALKAHPLGPPILAIGQRLRENPLPVARPEPGEHDVILCYVPGVRDAVRPIARQLRRSGVVPWIPEDRSASGTLRWDASLERELDRVWNIAVFIGPTSAQPWDSADVDAAIRYFISRGRRVTWVILPDVGDLSPIPEHLRGSPKGRDSVSVESWIDFRLRMPNPVHELSWYSLGRHEKNRVSSALQEVTMSNAENPAPPPSAAIEIATTLTWVHLSDLHLCQPKTGWDSHRVLRPLLEDLRHMRQAHGLRPDFVFFTGDLAFGQIGRNAGETLADQFDDGHTFLESVRTAFVPHVPRENVFVVPGNHDVDRSHHSPALATWLDAQRDPMAITELIRKGSGDWPHFMKRLAAYGAFLERHSYAHLIADPERLVYAQERDVRGVKVGIAGLNSAWTCGRDDEKSHLWLGGDWQIGHVTSQMANAQVRIALIHHPANWFSEFEDPHIWRLIERDFTFCLHGHEHQGWVTQLAEGHTRIAAAAGYDGSGMPNGYNFVQLDLTNGSGAVWLRQFDANGGGWIKRVIAKKAPDGVWSLTNVAKLTGT